MLQSKQIEALLKRITELEKENQALKDQALQYQQIAENMPLLICSYLPGGEISFVNKAYSTFFNKNAEDLVGLNFLDLIPESDRAAVTASINELTPDTPSQSHEHKVNMPNGDIGWHRWTNLAYFDPHRTPIAYQAIGEDITGQKKAALEIEKIKRFFTEAEQIVHLGVWVWNIRDNSEWWSDEQFRIFGYEPGEIQPDYTLFTEAIHHLDKKSVLEAVRKTLEDNTEYNEEFRIIRPSGEIRHILAQGSMTRSETGEPLTMTGTVLDITERKRRKDEILAVKNTLLEAQEFAKLGIWECDLKEDLVTWSDEHCKIYGIDPNESPFPFSRLMDLIPDEYHEYHKSQVEKLLSSGSADFEYPVKRSDGRFQWVWAKGRLKTDDTGRPTHMFGFTQDITERKHAEIALKTSEERFKAIYEYAPVLINAFDKDGKCILWNDECHKTFGWTIEEVKAHGDALSLFYPDPNIRNEVIRTVTTDPEAQFREWHPKTKDGRTLDTMWANFTLPDGLTLNLGYDITHRRELESRLLQAQKMESIGSFAGGIAHDFNNILSSVIGFTELALSNVYKNSSMEEDLQEVYSAGLRAKELVQQILTFARQSDEALKPIQIDIIIEEAIKFLRSTIPTTIEIKHDIESSSTIIGNSTQIHRIMMNLCTNAADAMNEEGGTLEITLKDISVDGNAEKINLPLKPGNYIEIKVSDTGVGIEQQHIDNIFDPYFTTKAQGEGTGLGLAMVHGIVETYGGKIIVDSAAGQGTVFTILLPIVNKMKAPNPEKLSNLPTGQERILIVDDEAPIAKMTSRILSQLGYTVTTTASGAEALELFTAMPESFDLVISDVTMPHMSGDQLSKKLIEIRPKIPVILCTGYSKRLSEKEASDIGVKAFTYKPLEKGELAKTVRKVLDSAKE